MDDRVNKEMRDKASYSARRKTEKGLRLFIRPAKGTDERALKEFFDSISEDSMYSRFMEAKKRMSRKEILSYTIIDPRQMVILALYGRKIIGMAQYDMNESNNTADVAFLVRDDYQHMGVGRELLKHITYIAKKEGILGFSAEVLTTNEPMIRLFDEMDFYIEKRREEDTYEYRMIFKRGDG